MMLSLAAAMLFTNFVAIVVLSSPGSICSQRGTLSPGRSA
jgi:hypothetical protein